jgi:hypothetical protein
VCAAIEGRVRSTTARVTWTGSSLYLQKEGESLHRKRSIPSLASNGYHCLKES